MSDFTLSRESVEIVYDYSVEVSRFENQWDISRLVTENAIVGFKIKTPKKTKTQMMSYVTFFQSKYGAATSFTFTCPLDDVEYKVRFVKGSFRVKYEEGHFYGQFELERAFS